MTDTTATRLRGMTHADPSDQAELVIDDDLAARMSATADQLASVAADMRAAIEPLPDSWWGSDLGIETSDLIDRLEGVVGDLDDLGGTRGREG